MEYWAEFPVLYSKSLLVMNITNWHLALISPVVSPGKSHGQRSLVGCSPWGRSELDRTEWPHFPFSLSCIGEGNGNPLQCSCLENPRDGGAWWAAVYGVAQSWTRWSDLAAAAAAALIYTWALYILCPLNALTTLWGRYYYPHFTSECWSRV